MILKLKPALKDYIWGGQKLKTDFGFQSDMDIVAEGWMLTCHKDGENIVENGEFAGKTLSETIDKLGKETLGKHAQRFDRFPILIKLIDAKTTCPFRCTRTTNMHSVLKTNTAKQNVGIFLTATPVRN